MNNGEQKKQRSCVGCSKKQHRSSFVRLIKSDSGKIVIDGSGKMAGRGAYVCSEGCLEASLSKGSLQRALRTKIHTDEHDSIVSEFKETMSRDSR